ncbi:MAG: phosphoenolpyruvate--protein phosphotransferase [Rhizobiales bacterium]|nr:phosphoenolpyruvate--protein phosphotransferase [Hyphomicrobiales bacterium]
MRGNLIGPRVLLRRLREAMAGPGDAQKKLDSIVVLIASNMVAEVCSIYVMRGNIDLELVATEGLNPDAVHQTRLKVGEGLVGQIAAAAESLSLSDAQSHPAFAYRPETGEEIYHSFLGVPILRGGHTLGVLVVQNKARRDYSEEEVEALLTTAMVLAEMIAASDVVAPVAEANRSRQRAIRQLHGTILGEGVGLGHAVLHEPRVIVTNLIAEDASIELSRLNEGIGNLRAWTDQVLLRREVARTGEHRDVLEAYRMFAYDRGWANRMREAVGTGLTAEAAVERVQNDNRARMMRLTDPYMRERLHDLDDLSNRLLRLLAGHIVTAAGEDLPDDAIVIARNMGPADLLDYDTEKLRGLILEESGPGSHVAIVARAIGIAAVGQVAGILDEVEPGDAIIVDGDAGDVHLRPGADVELAYRDKVQFHAEQQARYRAERNLPATTQDGQDITLLMNAGLLVDLPHLDEAGAAGIGLYRTELQFMVAARFPRMEEQRQAYSSILKAAHGMPVVFRSLDVGGDKILPYLRHAHEENPALGWRAIRMALDRPGLFRTQIRALLHAARGQELRVMFPMITEVAEFDQAKDMVNRELRFLEKHGHEGPSDIKLGTMIEVPAILWDLEALFERVDFASIGSNDLLQFFWASDRGNARMSDRYDPLSPPVLRMLRDIQVRADAAGTPLTLCGEMAGRPVEAMALLGLGIKSISMAPPSIGPVKEMLRKLDIGLLQDLMGGLSSSGQSLRQPLEDFAKMHNIPI